MATTHFGTHCACAAIGSQHEPYCLPLSVTCICVLAAHAQHSALTAHHHQTKLCDTGTPQDHSCCGTSVPVQYRCHTCHQDQRGVTPCVLARRCKQGKNHGGQLKNQIGHALSIATLVCSSGWQTRQIVGPKAQKLAHAEKPNRKCNMCNVVAVGLSECSDALAIFDTSIAEQRSLWSNQDTMLKGSCTDNPPRGGSFSCVHRFTAEHPCR